MKRLINISLVVVVVLVSATCPYAQTRPRRVTQTGNTLAETTRSRTVERPLETREPPVERQPKHHNWMRILGTAAIIGASVAAGGRGSCTPSRDVFRGR